ncbi:glucose 1-dehydrogenase [Streptomyces sp. NPDC046909]|uniref:glucose 1-dehydrogenase n=1 Tax=Streptomyces sp. NPDC046909 TaxID=3155617 RepID=UPI0033D832EF
MTTKQTALARLASRVALVTGAARGQGEAIARLFVAEGAQVLLGDVLEEPGEKLAAELGVAARFVRLDVTDEGQWRRAVEVATGTFGRLDALVNNAGILHMGSVSDTTAAQFRRVVEVNQVGVFLGMKAAAPAIAAAGGGTIVNSASINAFVGVAGTVAYSASKWAVRGMTRTAALELGPRGIRVNAVAPGSVATAMIAPDGIEAMPEEAKAAFAKLPLGRVGRPEEIARAVLFLTSDESSYCTGAEFVVDGGSLAGPVYD